MAEYRLAPAAERDLEAIWVYTFHEWGSTQANRYIDRITKVFTELAHSPKTAQTCDHIRAGYRRRSVERHMIYFRVMPYGIAITRILHERMDAQSYI
ncbi:type II toxin-antitoxin system RelE/ParE family toxin [Pseudomonas syringae group genomosp. 3]|uniref:Toxin n=1 Tax=Pseudomonas syringae pv. primulae TaxID=251707 RepID=A0A3M3Y4Y6_9PSED|nr:type II toxin-antitoxin system RelE/ParE family toxin [Pseudomonas syringae group genomosp. 3]RMO76723.1 Plasmid stabilization element ParE [Pseudomonas syringae pv. primulae]RMU39056.1 Plasmid stabilization element ParE [Pseudomonas syringae pv. primulae]